VYYTNRKIAKNFNNVLNCLLNISVKKQKKISVKLWVLSFIVGAQHPQKYHCGWSGPRVHGGVSIPCWMYRCKQGLMHKVFTSVLML